MSADLSPIISEFETEEQAASYDRWFRAKVQASQEDPRAGIPHDAAMARVRGKLATKLAEQEVASTTRRSLDR